MWSILQGVFTIAAIIAIGYVLQRSKLIPDSSAKTLVDLSYWALSPALLFSTLAHADIRQVIGIPLIITALAGVISASIFAVVAKVVFRLSRGDMVLATMSSAVNNGAHLGIPIATYILGDPAYAVPIMIFQLGFFTPFFFVLADLAGGRVKPSFINVVRTVLTNPMVIASVCGALVSWVELPLPQLVDMVTSMIGGAAPPVVLIAFGASLTAASSVTVLRVGSRPDTTQQLTLIPVVAWVVIVKEFVQPLVAFLLSTAIGASPGQVMALTVMACLPSAQNAFIASVRAGTGQDVARSSVMVTTIVCLPVIMAVSWAFISLT